MIYRNKNLGFAPFAKNDVANVRTNLTNITLCISQVSCTTFENMTAFEHNISSLEHLSWPGVNKSRLSILIHANEYANGGIRHVDRSIPSPNSSCKYEVHRGPPRIFARVHVGLTSH
jgi:hypothetical protein